MKEFVIKDTGEKIAIQLPPNKPMTLASEILRQDDAMKKYKFKEDEFGEFIVGYDDGLYFTTMCTTNDENDAELIVNALNAYKDN